jgi:hypothetical protein
MENRLFSYIEAGIYPAFEGGDPERVALQKKIWRRKNGEGIRSYS